MLKELLGVEIFSAGTWNNDEYTTADLDAMVEAHVALGDRLNAPLKLGHDDAQKFLQDSGLPSFGWVDNLRREGEKLLADIRGIPAKIFDLIQNGAYRKRSAEILWDFEDKESGRTFSRVLCGLALLGAELPAVSTLDDILALYGGQASPLLHAYLGELDVRPAISDSDGTSETPDRKDHNLQQKEKDTVNFVREGGDSTEACGICRFFQPDYLSCNIVEGIIRPEDVCELYEQRERVQDQFFNLEQSNPTDKEVNEVDKDKDKKDAEKTYSAKEVEGLVADQIKAALGEQEKKYAEQREEDHKTHEEQRTEDRKKYTELRDERNMDNVIAFIDSLSTEKNMRIAPANKDRAVYLLAECGKSEPKTYAVKDDEGNKTERSYQQTLMDFMSNQENLSEHGLFDTKSHDEGQWHGVENQNTTEGKLLKRVKEYRESHPEVKEMTDLDVMEIVSKESPADAALFARHIASGGNE